MIKPIVIRLNIILKTTKLAMPFHAKDKEKLPYFQFNE